MSTIINKTTLQIIPSADTGKYPESEWIYNPILPNCDQKYWKISGNTVVEMEQSEKNIVDTAYLTFAKTQKIQESKALTESNIASGFTFQDKIYNLNSQTQIIWTSIYVQALAIKTTKDLDIALLDLENPVSIAPFQEHEGNYYTNIISKDNSVNTISYLDYISFFQTAVNIIKNEKFSGNNTIAEINEVTNIIDLENISL